MNNMLLQLQVCAFYDARYVLENLRPDFIGRRGSAVSTENRKSGDALFLGPQMLDGAIQMYIQTHQIASMVYSNHQN